MTKHGLKRLDEYSSEEIQYRLRNYTKVIAVREPFERILSGYRDKLFKNETVPLNLELKSQIVEKTRTSGMPKTRQDFVSLDEFVKYLTLASNDSKMSEDFDNHWRPAYYLCHPCDLKYDFIMKVETLENDLKHFTKYIVKQNIHISHLNPTTPLDPNIVGGLAPESVEKLKQLYALDYKLFGYKPLQ